MRSDVLRGLRLSETLGRLFTSRACKALAHDRPRLAHIGWTCYSDWGWNGGWSRVRIVAFFLTSISCSPTSMTHPDYYRILGLDTGASYVDVRRAYQATLLAAHPDKQRRTGIDKSLTVDLVREAFAVLGDPVKRADYDRERAALGASRGPRPAQVLSLDDFVEEQERWTYACRCGGTFAIAEAEMEVGTHLIMCGSCSEAIWVGYELG
jgi:diphthamide biosynthesis protein 4